MKKLLTLVVLAVTATAWAAGVGGGAFNSDAAIGLGAIGASAIGGAPSGAVAATPATPGTGFDCGADCTFRLFAGDSGYGNLPNTNSLSGSLTQVFRYNGDAATSTTWVAETGETLTETGGGDLTIDRGVPLTTAGEEAVLGDGTNYYAASTNGFADVGTSDFVLEVVLQSPATAPAGTVYPISKRTNDGGDEGWALLWTSSNEPRIFLDGGGTASSVIGSAVASGAWYHIIATRDHSDATNGLRLFVNGVADGTNGGDQDVSQATHPLTFFADPEFTSSEWDGELAYVSLWTCTDCVSGTASTVLDMVEERFALLTGMYADKVAGAASTAVPTAFGASSTATLDVADDYGTVSLFTMGAGWPRFVRRFTDFGERYDVRGYLSESAATNLVTHSSALNSSAWTKNNVTISADAEADLLGGSSADNVVDDGTSGAHNLIDSVTTSSSAGYVFSGYVKDGASTTATHVRLSANNCESNAIATWDLSDMGATPTTLGGEDAAGSEDVGGGWYRLWLAFTDTTGSTCNIALTACESASDCSYAGDSSVVFTAWGVQFEARDDQAPSSLIPTNGATATRNADDLQYADGTGDGFGTSTMLAAIVHSKEGAGAKGWLEISRSATGDNNRKILYNKGSSEDSTNCQVVSGGATTLGTGTTGVTHTDNRLAIACQHDTDFAKFYIAGVASGTEDTSGALPLGTADQISVGCTSACTSAWADDLIDEVLIRNVTTETGAESGAGFSTGFDNGHGGPD